MVGAVSSPTPQGGLVGTEGQEAVSQESIEWILQQGRPDGHMGQISEDGEDSKSMSYF